MGDITVIDRLCKKPGTSLIPYLSLFFEKITPRTVLQKTSLKGVVDHFQVGEYKISERYLVVLVVYGWENENWKSSTRNQLQVVRGWVQTSQLVYCYEKSLFIRVYRFVYSLSLSDTI